MNKQCSSVVFAPQPAPTKSREHTLEVEAENKNYKICASFQPVCANRM